GSIVHFHRGIKTVIGHPMSPFLNPQYVATSTQSCENCQLRKQRTGIGGMIPANLLAFIQIDV
ncbi:hypothetical protein, partial [Salmonella enterica]|uniref:hypothetical protein n=1 Tax=Salmonella enterica TaxID=28901 RepID=UPI0021B29B56